MSCQKLGFLDFGDSLLVFSTNLNLLYLLYLMVLRYYPLHLRRQNCFLKAFLRTLILITLVFLSLPAFCSRANLKQHDILVSRKLVQKVMTDFDSFKSSGPDDCIPVMDLKNSEPELSYILAEFCNICLKESYFPVCWKVSSVRSACI